MRWMESICLLCLFVCSAGTFGQDATNKPSNGEKDKKSPSNAVNNELLAKFGTPRQTFETFMLAMEEGNESEAIACLDLSNLLPETVSAKGGTYAYKIKYIFDVLEEFGFIDGDGIPDDLESVDPFFSIEKCVYDRYGLPLKGDDLTDVRKIFLFRGSDQLWRFSTTTVDAIDAIYQRWEGRVRESSATDDPKFLSPIWLRSLFPESMRQPRFILADYQWICLISLIFIGVAADIFVRWLLFQITHRWLRTKQDEAQVERGVWKPVGLLVEALIWYWGTRIIDLPSFAMQVLLVALKLFTCVAAVWTAFRLIDLLTTFLKRRADATETGFDDLLVPLVSSSLKVVSLLVGFVIFAEVFELPLTGLLGGLGLGGAALALASKDSISNLFGSFTVLVDRPFEIGDWVITEGVEGTVERVGFRSTRIRTFYNSLISLPNSRLTVAVVDNMGRRRYRRIRTLLSVTHTTTSEQIEAFCEGIRELIRRHPHTRKDEFHVYLSEFRESSFDILLYCFLRCPNWTAELQAKHKLFLDIVRLTKALDISFAYPSRTLHLYQEDSVKDDQLPHWSNPANEGQKAAAKVLEQSQNP